MFQSNIVQKILTGIDPIHAKSIQLRPGQLFQGSIVKLYPGQLATLKLGGIVLTAKLEAALIVGQRYWFQVQQGDGVPRLKVIVDQHSIRDKRKESHKSSFHPLFKSLGIAETKINQLLVHQFTNESFPFTKEEIMKGAELLELARMENNQGITVLKGMLQRNLPLTLDVFQAIKQMVYGGPLSTQLEELFTLVQQVNVHNDYTVKLQEQLLKIRHEMKMSCPLNEDHGELPTLEKGTEEFGQKNNRQNLLTHQFAQIIRRLGIDYESELFKTIDNQKQYEPLLDRLKPLLMQGEKRDLSPSIQASIEKVLQRITGQQLYTTWNQGLLNGYTIQVPLSLGHFQTDVTLQWEGKKNQRGELDPNFCRMFFYLQLEHLKETIIDVHIQNRVVSIQILNEKERPHTLIKQFLPLLKEKLNQEDFLLSTLKWIKNNEGLQEDKDIKNGNIYTHPRPNAYQGVDIRI